MRNLRFSLLLLAFLVHSYGRAGQSVSNSASKTGTVQGSVIDATFSQAIRRALVTIRKTDGNGIGAYTDETGKFAFYDVDPGTYAVFAEHDGFVRDGKPGISTVTVAGGAGIDAGTLKLNRTGAVSGHVTDPSGDPIMGASVQIRSWKAKKNQLGVFSAATTDDRGFYRAYNISPGKYKLSVTRTPNDHWTQIKMQVEKDKSLDANSETYATTYYGGTPDLAQGAALQIEPGAELQGVDVVLLRARAFRVAGRVFGLDGGQPGTAVVVVLNSAETAVPFSSQLRNDGSFEFLQVTPGKYSLSAIGMSEPGKQIDAHQLLEVGEADVIGVQLTLSRQQAVTGKVIAPPDRKIPQGLFLALQSRERTNVQYGNGGFAQLHEDGGFSVESIAPGDYDVVLATTGKGDDLYVGSIRSGGQDIFSSGLHIGANAPAPIEVRLQANGAEVDYSVLDANQKPVPDAQVTLLPDAPRRSQMALQGSCRTDTSGKCVMLGIAPGDYHAFAFRGDDPVDFQDPEIMASLENQGTPATVGQGDKKPLQLTVLQSEQ